LSGVRSRTFCGNNALVDGFGLSGDFFLDLDLARALSISLVASTELKKSY
jgi:hypothetical protein